MILSYSRDQFIPAIKEGIKIHTIRTDSKRRWKPGMKIQHWRGNPRNVKQNPYQFAEGECNGTQDIYIQSKRKNFYGGRDFPMIEVWIGTFSTGSRQPYTANGRWITDEEVQLLAQNDNLTLDEFREWFVPDNQPVFQGRIIHFTDFRY